jgi:hypothetical protein
MGDNSFVRGLFRGTCPLYSMLFKERYCSNIYNFLSLFVWNSFLSVLTGDRKDLAQTKRFSLTLKP